MGATIVVLTEAWQKKLDDNIGSTTVISNPVDPILLPGTEPRDNEHLLLLGRDNPVKNHAFAMEIASELQIKRPGLKLSITGIKRSTHPFIHALGWVTEEKKIHLLQTASVLLLPSLYEGQPMVALEANACRLPIVASSGLFSLPSSTVYVGPKIEEWISVIDTLLENPLNVVPDDNLPLINTVQLKWMECYSSLLE